MGAAQGLHAEFRRDKTSLSGRLRRFAKRCFQAPAPVWGCADYARYCTLAALFSWFCAHAQRGALADQWASVGAGAATGTGATPGARTGRHQDTAQPGRYRGATGRNTATATGTRGPDTGRALDHGRRYRPGHHHGRAAMGLALDHGHQRQHGQHRPGTTTPARAAPRAHGPAGARHYLVQAPGSATHYRHTAVAPLQVAAVGSARGRSAGAGRHLVQAGYITCSEPRRPPAWHHRQAIAGARRTTTGPAPATSRGQRNPLRRPETAPQGRGLGRGNGATGNPYRAQFLQCAGQTKSCQRFQARTAKKEEGRESVIHKKSE